MVEARGPTYFGAITILPVILSATIAAACLLGGAVLAQGAAKPTDPQIAHIAYTADEIDIEAAKQALAKSTNKGGRGLRQRREARP
jgi:putative membrane protein